MAVINQVNLSNLEFGNRIDGEIYNPYLKKSYFMLQESGLELKALKELCIIKSGTTPPDRDDTLKNGPILFKTTDIRNNVLNPNEEYYHISNKIYERMSTTKIKDEDVLLNIVGATLEVIGRSAYVSSYFPEANITQAMVFLRIKKLLKAGYLFAYLNTKFAQDQVKRYARPTGQYNLNLQEVGYIKIPIIDIMKQQKIHDLIEKSGKLSKSSSDLYQQATELLDKELELDTIEFEKPRSYTATFSEVISNNRADSEYYQVHFRQIEEHLKSLNTLSLGTICSFIKGYEVGSSLYTENGPTFIRVSNFTKHGFSFGDSDKHISNGTYNLFKGYKPNIGDILLTKDGTVGMCYVVDEEIEGIISSGIVNLTLLDETIPKEYLALVINSKICQMQANRDCSGALISHWKPQDIRKMKIPLLDVDTMQQLNDLVVESKSALRESKQLLEQAKQRVEELIETAAGGLNE